jgi:hypothetical protein
MSTSLWIVVATSGLMGGVFVWCGLWRDRARGRMRCPRCWYDMSGVINLTCPECGTVHAHTRSLARTRRHWPAVVLGCALLIGAVAASAAGRIRDGRWVRYLPTEALILLTPDAGHEWTWNPVTSTRITDPVAAELNARFQTNGFTDRQWRMVLTRTGIIQTRRRWPVDQELVIGIIRPDWLGLRQIRISRVDAPACMAKAGSLIPFLCGNEARGVREMELSQTLGRVSWDMRSLDLDVEVVEPDGYTGDFLRAGPVRRIWSGRISIPIEPVRRAEQAMPLADSDEIEAGVKQAITISLDNSSRRWWSADDFGLMIEIDRTGEPCLEDLAFGMTAELIHNGVTISRTSLPARDIGWPLLNSHSYTNALLGGRSQVDESELDGWELRLLGDASKGLGAWTRNRAWGGEIVVPLRDLLQP